MYIYTFKWSFNNNTNESTEKDESSVTISFNNLSNNWAPFLTCASVSEDN